MTPAAFIYFCSGQTLQLNADEVELLRNQFTSLPPMIQLGTHLATSGFCSSCMDNTDGIGQSLTELAEASSTSFIIDVDLLEIPQGVARIAELSGQSPLDFVFNGGADFSLVGTLKGSWSNEEVKKHLGTSASILGRVDDGTGLWLEETGSCQKLKFKGWNYFVD